MFYDLYAQLCKAVGKSPSAVAQELGINKSTVTVWKKNQSTPKTDILQKIADYFGVTTDYLLTGETKKSPASSLTEDEELNELLEELKNNPGKRLLFSKTKNATKEDIEKIVAMVDILTAGTNGYYF